MIALWFTLCLLLAEVLLRAYHTRTCRQHLPSELRARTRAIARGDIQGKQRIVCLGDSNTFGEEMPFEEAYPHLLQTLIRQRHPDWDVVVINSGIRGHTAVQGLARLERDVFWYQPHGVVVSFGLNDGSLGRWPLDAERERQMRRGCRGGADATSLLGRSHLYRTVYTRTRRVLRSLGCGSPSPEVDVEDEMQPRVSSSGFELAQECLVARIRRNGAGGVFLCTMNPVTSAFFEGVEPTIREHQLAIYSRYNQIIRDVAKRHGAHLVDVCEELAKVPGQVRDGLLASDGVHHTPAGERTLAEMLLGALEKSGLPTRGWRPAKD